MLLALWFALGHYAALLGLGAVSYAIGRKLTARCPYRSTGERVAVSTSLGVGTIAYLVFALCLVHWLYPAVVLALLLGLGTWGLSALRAAAGEVSASLSAVRKHPRLQPIGIGLLIVFLPPALLALYPPFIGDATYYHLALAKLYVQHHGFVFTPYLHFSLFPQLTEMLFTIMLALFDDVASQSVCFLLLVLLVVAITAFGAQLFSRTAAYWAAAILLANPMVIFLGSVAYIDMALTLFVTGALHMCWNWVHERHPQWLLWTAVFVGLALGTKYTAFFFLAFIGLVIGAGGGRRRYTAVMMFLAIGLAVAAPWYARGLYYTGNPVFPFFPHVFGYGFWTAEDITRQMYELHLENGVGWRLWSFIALPWHLAFRQKLFNTEATGDPGFYLLMPALLAFAVVDRRILALCTVVLVYLVFWFFSSQETRYLVPVFPLVSLAMGAALDKMLQAARVRCRGCDAILVGIIFALVAYPGWNWGTRWVRGVGFPPYTQDRRERFLSGLRPSYPAYQILNALKGQNYTLYAFEDPFMAYFCDGSYMGDEVGPGRYSRIRNRLADSRALYRELRSLGADYFLIARGAERPHKDQFFLTHFRLMYASRGVELFEISRPSH